MQEALGERELREVVIKWGEGEIKQQSADRIMLGGYKAQVIMVLIH